MKSTFHRAGWIMIDPENWMENGVVELVGNRLASVKKSRNTLKYIDHGDGVIMAPLGNAHTHLSLSALKGRLECRGGFLPWVQALIETRETVSHEKALEAALFEAREMKRRGIGIVADVGPLEPGREALKTCGIAGVCYVESLGASDEFPEFPPHTPDLKIYPAAHGPHTTGPEKLVQLKTAGERFSVHLAESELETEFLAQGKGAWADLMTLRGHDIARWEPWGERPVERVHRLGLLGPSTLAVHLLEILPEEIDVIAGTGTRVCLCPRSNWALHNKLPYIEGLLHAGIRPALGTDSPASVKTLDMFDEMAFTAERYPGISPETILAMATVNVAEALGSPTLGRLDPGRTGGGVIHVAINAQNSAEAASALVSGKPREVSWL